MGKTILEKLKEYFDNTSEEQIKKDWDKSAKYDEVNSPTIEQFMLLRVSNWVAYKDAKFLKCGKEYLIYVNDYVTTDEWLDDGLGFREHGNDIIKVSELPKPPC